MTAMLPVSTGRASGPGEAPARIVLSWLIRLRWLAVVGQVVAIVFTASVLEIRYPAGPLVGVLATTLLTNLLLLSLLRAGFTPPGWITPAVLLLDVGLLTVLLYFTGGPANPFAVLYVVHVAMATVVLGPAWAWATVLVAAACFGLLFIDSHPLTPDDQPLPAWASSLGQWAALSVVAGLLAYFIGRVVGALRRREGELAQVRDRAALNERLASLTTLAAGAAHELGTPLGTIAIVAKEIEIAARAHEDEDLAEDAMLIRQQVERCRNIIEHMRGDVAGRTTDAPGRCDVADVVEGVLSAIRPDRRERLVLEASDHLPDVAAGCRAVQQAVTFLVNNGFDASPPTAAVTLAIRPSGDEVLFSVRDPGSGMDADTLRRATEPFFTTKEPGSGMGLGLFLVRLVADRNGGAFELESRPGRGTTARLRMPAVTNRM